MTLINAPIIKNDRMVLKEGLSWRSIATFCGDYEIFPKWQTVYAFYKKLIINSPNNLGSYF